MDNNQTTEEVLRDQEIEKEIEPKYLKEESLVNKQRPRYAGFWMRFWAYLLDLIVVGSIDRILVKPLFRLLDIPLLESNLFAPISIATAITFYAYFVLMTRYFQQTLGKMVFGLKVVGLVEERLSWKTILFREWIGRFISSTIVIGYIITAFLPKKQGLHDLFSDTSVVHEY
jgi:uncharacterized RDD family membrane protein YckC